MVADWVQSGWVTDLILGIMVVEAVFLSLYLRKEGLKSAVSGFLAALLAGAFLVLALRFALTGGTLGTIAIFLGLSLLAHLTEVVLKIRSIRTNPNTGSQT